MNDIDSLSIDELLKLAAKPSNESKEDYYLKQVKAYVTANGLRADESKSVKLSTVYTFYVAWTREVNKPRVGKKHFFKAISKLFSTAVSKNRRTIYINRTSLGIESTYTIEEDIKTGFNTANQSAYPGVYGHDKNWIFTIFMNGKKLRRFGFRSEVEAAKSRDRFILRNSLNDDLTFPELRDLYEKQNIKIQKNLDKIKKG